MLSQDCYGCKWYRHCRIRYINVRKGEFVYCEDGSRHLVESDEY